MSPYNLIAAMAVMATSAAVPALSAPLPVYREIKDWVVACDNTAACEAAGAAEDQDTVRFRLRHGAGPEGALSLRIESAGPLALDEMRLDGQRLMLDERHWHSAQEDGGSGLINTDGDSVRAFLDAVRNGHRLTFGGDEPAPWGSLSGLSAALLLIDETQGRLGTTTALLRRGPQPASRVPTAHAPPLLRAAAPMPEALSEADQRRLIAAVRQAQAGPMAAQGCFVEAEGAYDQAIALTDTEALVFIECWRGAYQSSSLLFRTLAAAPARAQPLVLPLPDSMEGGQNVDAFTSAGYVPERGLLSHFAKGRGLADCGESAAWIFDGKDFQLASYTRLGVCRGGNPGEWPVLWRSRTD